jgi:hypothetical protein
MLNPQLTILPNRFSVYVKTLEQFNQLMSWAGNNGFRELNHSVLETSPLPIYTKFYQVIRRTQIVDSSTIDFDETDKFFPTQPALSPEEAFVLFLKHHRKFALFKRKYWEMWSSATHNKVPAVDIIAMVGWGDVPERYYWIGLEATWKALCSRFNYTDLIIDINKALSIR